MPMRALVVTFHVLRPDFLGVYGNEWIDTPHFDALAAEAIVFDRHLATDLNVHAVESFRALKQQGISTSESADVNNLARLKSKSRILCLLSLNVEIPDFSEAEDLAARQELYAARVAEADEALGSLIQLLNELDILEELLLIVSSDHGIDLGETAEFGESPFKLHEQLVHLPLIVRLPKGEQAGRRVGSLTQPVDLLPTMVEFFGLTAVSGHGQSLLPLCKGEKNTRPYAVSHLEAEEWALRTLDWAFLYRKLEPTSAFYIKPDDRCEVNDIRQHYLEMAESLEKFVPELEAVLNNPNPELLPPLPAAATLIQGGTTDEHSEAGG